MSSLSELIRITYEEVDNTRRDQAQELIKSLQQDFPEFCRSVLGLLSSEETEQVKLGAATLLRNSMRGAIKAGQLSQENFALLVESIFQCMRGIPTKSIRNTLSHCLSPLFDSDTSGLLIKKMLVLISDALQMNKNNVLAGLMALRIVFSTASYFLDDSEDWIGLIWMLRDTGRSAWSEFHGKSDPELLDILDEWSFCVKQIVEMFQISTMNIVKGISNDSEFAELFWNVLSFKAPDVKFVDGGGFLSITDSPTHNVMNCIKGNLMAALNCIFQYLVDSKKKYLEDQGIYIKVMSLVGVELPDSPFVNIIYSLLNVLIEFLLVFTGMPQYWAALSNNALKNALIEMLGVLTKASAESRFFHLFFDHHRQISLNACLSILSLKPEEREQFEDLPEEFINHAVDICEKQESQSVQTECAKLLENLCINIDGCLPNIIGFLHEATRLAITSQPLSNLHPCSFLSLDSEIQIETSFFVFSVLSYSVTKRSDLLNMIETLMNDFRDSLQTVNSALIHSRLCLFFYFYTNHIYSTNDEAFENWITYLVNCLVHPSRAVNLQACETLSFVLQDEDILMRLDNIIPQVFPAFVMLVSTQTDKRFFEMLSDIVQSYRDEIQPYVLDLVRALVIKIQTVNGSNIIFSKCWNIIRTVAESAYIKNMHNEFESALSPLYKMLQDPTMISYEEDLLIVIVSVIKKTSIISQLQWEVFECLPRIQAKNQYSLIGLFRPLNIYIAYGNLMLSQNPRAIQMAIDMATHALFSEPVTKPTETINAQGALILHILMHYLVGNLDDCMEHILYQAQLRFEKSHNNNFFIARVLGVFLSALIYNCKLTMEILGRSNHVSGVSYFRMILSNILHYSYCFTHSYDKKILVMGLSQVLVCDLENVSQMYPQLLECCIIVLEQKGGSLGREKEKMIMDYSDDEMIDNELIVRGTKMIYNKDFVGNNEETEANISLSLMVSPLADIDEYEHFRTKLNYLHENYKDFIRATIAGLTNQRKEQLIQILNSRRVKLNDLPGENTTVRRIVSTKTKG